VGSPRSPAPSLQSIHALGGIRGLRCEQDGAGRSRRRDSHQHVPVSVCAAGGALPCGRCGCLCVCRCGVTLFPPARQILERDDVENPDTSEASILTLETGACASPGLLTNPGRGCTGRMTQPEGRLSRRKTID